jgi:hypothetical protein
MRNEIINKKGRNMIGIKTEISKIDNLTELNALSTYIKECKVMLAKTNLSVGMKVWVVQKTKRTEGVITKMKLKKANVDMRGSSYSVPFSMLEAI